VNVLQEYGDDLRLQRLALGLSREEAYKKFRVPLTFISAIEEGRIDDLPAPIFTRGFVKTYCEALGLSPDAVINAYEDHIHRPQLRGLSRLRAANRADRPAWLDDAIMWAAIVGIVLFGWVSYSLLVRPGTSGSETHVQAESVELPIDDPFAAP
jgi:cytoskeletal protein RodZ